MEKKNNITNSQLIILLITSMVGTGIFSLPNDVLKYAKQDGWISCIIGSIYPFLIIFTCCYICNLSPNENIYTLSKQCFGKFIGTILNIVFALYFLIIGAAIADGMTNILKVHALPFLTSSKILIVFLFAPAFVAYKGLNTISRVSEIIFYITLILFFIPFGAIKSGSLHNIFPILGSGITNIIIASKDTAMAYTGIEAIFLLYPFVKNKNKITKNSIIGVSITTLIYTSFTFITIYYLGIDIIPKFIWSALLITNPLAISIINNFRSLFIILWTSIMFKIIALFYYCLIYSLNQLFNKVSISMYTFLMYPLFTFLALTYGPPVVRANIIDKILPTYVIFNILYPLSIAIIKTIKNYKSTTQ